MKNMPENHNPQANAWTAEFPPEMSYVVFAQIGIQSKSLDHAAEHVGMMKKSFDLRTGPKHVDRALHQGADGYQDSIFLAYWDEPETFKSWVADPEVQKWWSGKKIDENSPIGYWSEVTTIPIDHFETLHSGENYDNGVSHFVPIKHTEVHEYWGAMRDRMPVSASSDLESPLGLQLPEPIVRETFEKRLKVTAPDNICLIRTAQNWSKCGSGERETYIGLVEPTLIKANTFLRENASETGCISSKLVYEQTHDGEIVDKSCVIGYYLSMGHLERWTHDHPTHKAIYGTFYEMLKRHDFKIELALWHEVSVLQSKDIELIYVNCHPSTGFLPFFEVTEIQEPLLESPSVRIQ